MYIYCDHFLSITTINHIPHLSINDLIDGTMILAQKVEDPNVIGQMQKAWQEFVKTGRLWSMLIGVFLGYVFRSFLP